MSNEDQPTASQSRFYCPVCHFPSEINVNPKFCTNCGYSFPRNSEGFLKINPHRIASRENIQTTIPQSFQDSSYSRIKGRTWGFWPGFIMPIVSIIIIGLAQIILILLFPNNLTSMASTFITSTVSVGFFFIPLFWVKRYYREPLSWQERLKELWLPLKKYQKTHLAREILLGVVLGLGMQLAILLIQPLAAWLVEKLFHLNVYTLLESDVFAQFQLSIPNNIWEMLAFILMMVLFVGLPEEIMFRGFVQRSFETKLNKGGALLLTATFFALFHIISFVIYQPVFFYLLLNYLFLSICLGLVRNWRGDVVATASAHTVYNIIQTLLLYFIFL